MEKKVIRLLQDDCSAYSIEGKNGSTHEVDADLAARMISSGHATVAVTETKETKTTTKK